MSRIPELGLPIVGNLYDPTYDPQKELLNHGIALAPDVVERVEKQVKEVEARLFSGETPGPLSREDAIAVEQKVDELQDAISATRMRISAMSAKIDLQASPDGQPEVGFAVDLTKKARLRRAIKKALGIKTDTLTYSMYKTALAVKRSIEESEADGYVSGDLED